MYIAICTYLHMLCRLPEDAVVLFYQIPTLDFNSYIVRYSQCFNHPLIFQLQVHSSLSRNHAGAHWLNYVVIYYHYNYVYCYKYKITSKESHVNRDSSPRNS